MKGFSLIEFMVTLTLSLFFFSCLSAIYFSAEKNFELIQYLSLIEDNSRNAEKILQSEFNGIQNTIEANLQGISLRKSNGEISYFFVADSGRKNNEKQKIFSLFMQKNRKPKIELIEGIKNMEIIYDVYLGGNTMHVPPAEVADWKKIVGMTVILTFSENHLLQNKKSMIYIVVNENTYEK